MFRFLFSHIRVAAVPAALWMILCLPFPLLAETEQEGAVIADPAPAVVVPEPVTIRAEPQPLSPPPAEKRSSAVRIGVRSSLSMLLDKSGTLDQSAAAARLNEFSPYAVSVLSRETGALWLHLDLADVKDSAPHTLWLNLGSQIPAGVSTWISADGRTWQSVQAESFGVYDLLSAGRQGQVLLRLNGLPGLWFSPALCSPHAVMDSPERLGHLFSLAALALLGFLCLLLSVTERGEGRFWTGVLAFAAMAQIGWGVPATPSGSVGTWSFPGMFAAGVALFMLPHAGRVLMRTRVASPFVDTLFLLFALPGACAAIVPLLPGMAWTARLLPLWPLAALLCLFPAVVLMFRGVQGGGPFTLACLSMGGGAVVSLWGLLHGLESPWWGLAVQAGEAAGLLFLASAAPHRDAPAPEPELSLDASPRRSGETRANTYKDNSLAALRRAFRGTVEDLFDEACRLDLALSRAGVDKKDKVDIMTHADAMTAAARRLSESALDLPSAAALPEASSQVFELRQVIQKVFASVFDEAEKKGLGLAWYVAPQIGQKFRGDAARLTSLLTLLLADAVRASSHGAVSLHVRRSAESTHPGHLQFTVSDNGEAAPPRGRQSALLARAWELASAHGGDLFVDSTPQGMELSFSMECTAMESDGVTERSMPPAEGRAPAEGKIVILASPDGLSRQLYAHYLSDMGCAIWEARDAEEAAALYAASPASLVVFDGALGEDDMVQGLAAIRMFEGEQSLPAAPFLLLARDDMQAERMAKAGCDESLLLPVVRKDLRAMTRWLLSPTSARPVLSTQRVTLAAVLAGAHSGSGRMQPKAVRRAPSPAAPAQSAPKMGETATEAENMPVEAQESAQSAQVQEASASEKPEKKGWLSSLFHGRDRAERPLEVKGSPLPENGPTAPESEAGSGDAMQAKRAEEARPAGAERPAPEPAAETEGEVVELLAEEVLVDESDVHELRVEDRVPDESDAAEFIELDASLIRAEGEAPEAVAEPSEKAAYEAEERRGGAEMAEPNAVDAASLPSDDAEKAGDAASSEEDAELATAPAEVISAGLNRISDALLHGDVQAIRSGSRELSLVADRYGMHTLADMARCFRAAWEEGDVEAAAQIVEEMRAEATRL